MAEIKVNKQITIGLDYNYLVKGQSSQNKGYRSKNLGHEILRHSGLWTKTIPQFIIKIQNIFLRRKLNQVIVQKAPLTDHNTQVTKKVTSEVIRHRGHIQGFI